MLAVMNSCSTSSISTMPMATAAIPESCILSGMTLYCLSQMLGGKLTSRKMVGAVNAVFMV